jgi:hypothetical protein
MRWLNTVWLILCLAVFQGSPAPVTLAGPTAVSDTSTTGKAIRPGQLHEVAAQSGRANRIGPPARDQGLTQDALAARIGDEGVGPLAIGISPINSVFRVGREQLPRAPPRPIPRTH